MAFTVETGTGLSNANSYLSVVDTDSYHANHSGSTDWSGASNADKEKALRLATQYLDVSYDGRWKGSRSNEAQSLAWPRQNVVDNDEYIYSSNTLPQKLKDAVAELALKVIEGNTLLDDIDEPGVIKREKTKIGPLEDETEYIRGKSQNKKYQLINALVKPLITASETMERG